MIESHNILIVIPARGGSKGIPRKNLRTLADRPLIYFTIKTSQSIKNAADVYVSSEDLEILSISKKLGVKTIKREKCDSEDITTLDPVVYNALKHAEEREKKVYDIVVTLQPTSPLLKVESLDSALNKIISKQDIDTVISCVNDTHLTWVKGEDGYYPNYEKRVNRQELPQIFKETGGFLITRSHFITKNNRIGQNVELWTLSETEAIDIDTHADWALCEYYLKRKTILFVVSGYQEIGLGHVYNALLVANDLVNHEIIFLVDSLSQLAFEKIRSKNYKVYKQECESILQDIINISPDIVINDRLDTTSDYIRSLKQRGYKVINFEDLGAGAKKTDLTINAIYPEDEITPNHYFGYKYFVLRDEFLLTEKKLVVPEVKTVLLSFGGIDPNNYTRKVLSSIYEYCQNASIEIVVVTGFGYKDEESLKDFGKVKIYRNVQNISDHMKNADIILTSAGRTAYEIASLGVPAIVLAQNDRELTHLFATAENGFTNLGLGYTVSNEKILRTFTQMVINFQQRKYMSELMNRCDLGNGRNRVMKLIKKVIDS